MITQTDTRDYKFSEDDAHELERLASFAIDESRALPGEHTVRVSKINPTTGTPATLTSENAAVGGGSLVSQALRHVQNVGSALGFAPQEPAEFMANPHVQKTSSGASVVHL